MFTRFSGIAAVALSMLTMIAVKPVSAQTIFNASIDTSSLVGDPSGPFYLDFQLTDGSGTNDANNLITITGLNFGVAGGALGTETLSGGATGSLSSTITLTDSSFFNELYQPFTPGSLLSFQISLTGGVDGGLQPDEFTFAILTGSLNTIETSDPGGALFFVDLDTTNVVHTFAAQAPYSQLGSPTVNPQASSVPEAGSAGLVAGCIMVGLSFLTRQRRGRARQ